MIYIYLFLAVVVGYIVAVILKSRKVTEMSIFLAFSGAFLLAMTVFELLPEVYENGGRSVGIWIMAGILLQICLEFFSKGAEHGHVHIHSEAKDFPWLLFISLSIHALLEGFPVHESDNLLVGILIHKIPVAIILSMFFIKAKYPKATTLIFLGLFAAMTPLGAYLIETFEAVNQFKTELNALVIGIFLHVSTIILFESSKNHTFNLSKMTAVVIAMIIAYFI